MEPYCCVTFVNNVVGHNTDDDGWHAGANLGLVRRLASTACRIINNTFERGIGIASEHIGPGPYSGVIANNIGGGWACLPGVTYSGNVGTQVRRVRRRGQPLRVDRRRDRAVRLDATTSA